MGAPNWWNTVERYSLETIMDFNNFTSAIVTWNMILDETGGPVHNRNLAGSAPITVDRDTKDFSLTSLYYAKGHFSKFIKRGAIRIGCSSYNDSVKVAAFANPNGEMVVVVLNMTDNDETPKLRLNNCTATFLMPAKSLQTFVIPPHSK